MTLDGQAGWGRSVREPAHYMTVRFRYKNLKPVCVCGRNVGKYGALFCTVLVGEPKAGVLEGRCRRCYNDAPVMRQRLERIGRIYDAAGSDQSDAGP